MTTYNTGNPIGSTDARDLSDNAENFDKALGTLDATWVDRLGVTRDSFEGRLAKGSFYRVGDFTTGYTLTNMRQTLEYSGHEYSWAGTFPKVVAAGATPATSGGIGAGAWVDRTDETLRAELASVSGSAKIGAERTTVNQLVSVAEWLSLSGVNLWEYAYLITDRPTPEDASTWDWSPAVIAADAAAYAIRESVLWPAGIVTLRTQVGSLRARHVGKGMGLNRWNTVGDWSQATGTCVYVEYGSGKSYGDYNSALFTLQSGASFIDMAFKDPTQDMAATPSERAMWFATAVGAIEIFFDRVDFGNAYVAVDARRAHSGLVLRNCRGYPALFGIRIGSMIDNDYIENLHFHPTFGSAETGTSYNWAKWVQMNGCGLQLGRNSYSKFDVFIYGYNIGIYCYYQKTDTDNGVTKGGGTEKVKLTGAIDSCFYPIWIDGTTLYGSAVTNDLVNAHYGFDVDMFLTAKEDSNFSNGRTGSIAIRAEAVPGYTRWLGKFDIKVLESGSNLAKFIRFSGLEFNAQAYNWDVDGVGAVGVDLQYCSHVKIDGHYDSQDLSRVAVQLTNNNNDITVDGDFYNYLTNAVYVANASNVRYKIKGNYYKSTSAGTVYGVIDENENANSSVSPRFGELSASVAASAGGLLTIPAGIKFIKMSGAVATLNGLTGAMDQRVVHVFFLANTTINKSSASVSSKQIIYGTGSIAITSGQVATFVSDGIKWFLASVY